VEVPREEVPLVERALEALTGGAAGQGERAAMESLPSGVRTVARAIAPLVIYAGDEPLARLEWVDAGAWISP